MVSARLATVAVLAIVVVACSNQPKPTTGTETTGSTAPSRYQHASDSAPPQPIDPSQVRDAVPRPDPILAVGNASPYTVNGVSYEVLDDYRSYRVRGTASWYGAKFHGHQTSNGEIYDLYQASAAHKTLPIPCYARVTNLGNGKSIIVRVNDRGPFHSDRVIDLSYGAAVKLGYMEAGTAQVEVAVLDIVGVDDRRGTVVGDYRYLQLGAYGSEDSARSLQHRLQELLATPVFVSPVQSGENMLYRVRIGPMDDATEVASVQQQLRMAGYDGGQLLP